ncbi:MAG: GMC family oxidoreductase, partial [Myxococcota bacterium]
MITDAQTLPDGEVLRPQICIAGAGAAGITIARDLIGRGLSVVVLEGGGMDIEGETQEPYRGQDAGDYLVGLDSCRLRYFGGTTNHWAGWCRRLTPDDFEV